jgi:hypothetical protein
VFFGEISGFFAKTASETVVKKMTKVAKSCKKVAKMSKK